MGDTCFVITPIGAPGSPQRARADRLCDLIIAPVLKDSEFDIEMVRGDRIQEPGPITVQLVEQLLDARLVVVDLVDPNPNVYYELGMAEAFHRPVVRFGGDAPLPFDVRDMRTLSLPCQENGSIDVADAMKCREELAGLLPIMLSIDYKPDSIVSRARRQAEIDSFTRDAQNSDNPIERVLADLVNKVDALGRQTSRGATWGSVLSRSRERMLSWDLDLQEDLEACIGPRGIDLLASAIAPLGPRLSIGLAKRNGGGFLLQVTGVSSLSDKEHIATLSRFLLRNDWPISLYAMGLDLPETGAEYGIRNRILLGKKLSPGAATRINDAMVANQLTGAVVRKTGGLEITIMNPDATEEGVQDLLNTIQVNDWPITVRSKVFGHS